MSRGSILRNDRDRKGGRVNCYTRNICFSNKKCLSGNRENVFIGLMFPKAKPKSVGIIIVNKLPNLDSPCNTFTLTDLIFTNTQNNIVQSGVIDTVVSYQFTIYRTRKVQ